LASLLEQARPAGTLPAQTASLMPMVWPSEHESHVPAIKVPATWIAFSTALAGFLLSTMFYGTRKLDPTQARQAFAPIYRFLLNKWWFDELYDFVFVRPTLLVSNWIAQFDRRWIDGLIDGLARWTRAFSNFWDWFADRTLVDGFVNWFAGWTYGLGLKLRRAETGQLRQYVMFIAIGTMVVFALASFWRYAFAQ
jgi:NADH-quinone oxidoreductase subunit L